MKEMLFKGTNIILVVNNQFKAFYMKQYILITFAILSLNFGNINAQESMSNPLNMGNKASSFIFTDTKNTENYVNNYKGQETNDVFYKFTLTRPMDVIVSHCGSELYDTYVHLLDASGNQIAYDDDYSGVGMCENEYQSYIKMFNLAAGTYYVVSEGYSDNGNITTNIQGIRPISTTSQNGGLDPSTDKNYILTITPLVKSTDANILTTDHSLQTLQYFDGLGRPMQTVQRNITPEKKDLVSSIEYDGVGRQSKQWLPTPIADNQGAFVDLNNVSGIANSIYADGRPFSEIIYEPSPLNRMEKQYGVGNSWFSADKSTKMEYQANIANNVAYYYEENNLLKRNTEYAANTLYVTKVSDEDGKPTYEFKDKQGQNINTYYVYNDLGQLCYVLPPLAADNLGTNIITGYGDDNEWLIKYAYLYRYDERGNNIVKRLPGCDYIYMVYDKADRMVLSQDGNQRVLINGKNQWTVTKYDELGRVISTGITMNIDPLKNLQSLVNEYKTDLITESYIDGTGYDNLKFSDAKPLTINYYDTYNFTVLQTNGNNLNYVTPETCYDAKYTNAKGLLTGTRTYILDNTESNYTASATYYDHRGRVVQTRSANHLGGNDIVYNAYDFTGKVTKTLKEHSISSTLSSPTTEIYTYNYDHAGRLLITLYELNHKPAVMLASNTKYDELGRLKEKQRHTGADIEEFDYNIRNWTTRIKSGTFEEKLYYNTNVPENGSPYYNGNIAANTWTYNGQTNGYIYYYDQLNRLGGNYSILNNVFQVDYQYSESFNYDKHSNINFVSRWDNQDVTDQLTLTYNGNQVINVKDNGISQHLYNIKEYQDKADNGDNTSVVEFKYDKNGNMTTDLDRDIVTIRYNILNLPDTIQFKTGNQIINRYDAIGRKLSTRYYTILIASEVPISALQPGQTCKLAYDMDIIDETGTFYVDNFEYKFNGCDPGVYGLDKVYNSEGYTMNPSNPMCFYYRKDHLGSIREVWYTNTNTTLQRTQYYPSGLPWAEGTGQEVQSRKYNGKEFVEMHGFDTYDYGARGYYPAIGRFMSVDPLAEKDYSLSPYAYCAGNPVNAIDPDGRDCIISVQRDDNNEITGVTFSATVYITGDGANQERADELTDLAKETYTSNKETNGVTIKFNVKYKVEPIEGVEIGTEGKNLLVFNKGKGRSQVEGDRDITHSGYQGNIYNSLDKSSNYDVMHETAHFFGLSDRYQDTNDGSIPNKGYKNDMMATNGRFDLSPNHYANMYEFAISQRTIQQDKFLKQIYKNLPFAAYKNKYGKSENNDYRIDFNFGLLKR